MTPKEVQLSEICGQIRNWRKDVTEARKRAADARKLADELDAWDALATELPSALRMPLPEARYVAHLLDEAAGRVGIEAP